MGCVVQRGHGNVDERVSDCIVVYMTHERNRQPNPRQIRCASNGLSLDFGMATSQPRNPLHGVTLKQIVERLVDHFGWEALGEQVRIRCFTDNPSIASSLRFLRKTPWAREKVESLYLYVLRETARQARQDAS